MRPFGMLRSLDDLVVSGQWMDDMMGWHWGFGVLGMVFWIAVLVLVAVAIWRLSQGRPGGVPGGEQESPLDILKRRYARGEIDRDEFEAKKRDLGYG